MGPPKKWTGRDLSHFFGLGGLTIRKLDFTELAEKHHPGVLWADLTPFQQVELIRESFQPRHVLVDPTCDYLKYWDLVILFALCYTAVVTPYEVAFLKTSFNPLFVFNRFIDLIFVKDMILQFFLKVQVQTQSGKVLLSDRSVIAKRYMRGWFAIDLMSILPFDTVGLALQNPAIQKLKVIRIVRLLRLLKLIRILRASRIMQRWENRTSLSYSAQGLIKFTVLLVVITHWMGCVWGMLGLLLATDLVCKDDGTFRIDSSIGGGSWITSRDWGPNNPCHHIDVYLASAHYAVMTITSIGYGDICPTRSEELFAGIMCQLMGGLTWAYVIGSICGIIASSDPVRVEFEQSMDALNRMMTEQNINHPLRMRLREYLREQKYHNLLLRAREIANAFSTELQEELFPETITGVALAKVWYFKSADRAFLVEISHRLLFAQHSPHEKIGGSSLLCILQRGSAVRNSKMCLPGDFWGADMIVTAAWLSDCTKAWALTYTEVLSLHREALYEVLQNHPAMEVTIRKAAVSIAFRNAIRMLGKENAKLRMGTQAHLSSHGARIANIFDELTKGDQMSLMAMVRGDPSSRTASKEKSQEKEGRVVHEATVLGAAQTGATSSDVSVLSCRLDEIQNALNKVTCSQSRMDQNVEMAVATGNQALEKTIAAGNQALVKRMDYIESLLMSVILPPEGPNGASPIPSKLRMAGSNVEMDLPNVPRP